MFDPDHIGEAQTLYRLVRSAKQNGEAKKVPLAKVTSIYRANAVPAEVTPKIAAQMPRATSVD